jgi:hypothetical protein
MFEGRKLVIATKHQKEQVLSPLLSHSLGVHVIVPTNLDTDLLGTFSGEVERKYDPLTTARLKCQWAMDLTNCDLAVASEGSFGSHPAAFFLPANEEWLLLVDRKNDLEIYSRHLSTETNFGSCKFHSLEELEEFSHKASFPSHGLILRPGRDSVDDLFKGIRESHFLREKASFLLEKYGFGFVETDMRAFMNPTRMRIIQETAEKLLRKILCSCPSCQMPGFAVTEAVQGLLCEWCRTPTRSILKHRLVCSHCGHEQEVLHPNGKSTEDPMYCDCCNP